MKLIVDLFKGPGNLAWDLGRFVAFGAGVAMVAGQAWNIWLGLPIDLGPGGLGGGLGAVLAGQAALIFAKDKAGSDARAVAALTPTAASAAPCPPARPKRKARRK